MKTLFTFYFDEDLKTEVKEHAKKQKPRESISQIIHRALYEYLNK